MIDQTISDKATNIATWLFNAASFLESREGKRFLNSDECIYPNLNFQRMKEGIENASRIALSSSLNIRSSEFTYSQDDFAKLALHFRSQAEKIVECFKLKFTAKMKKKGVNKTNIFDFINEISDVHTDKTWYQCYPSSLDMQSYPSELSDTLYALSSYGQFVKAIDTLRTPTKHPIFNAFLSSLRSMYFEGHGYFYDILSHDRNDLEENPNRLIKYNAAYPSSQIVKTDPKDSAFVCIDFKTGKISGESKVMFDREIKQLISDVFQNAA